MKRFITPAATFNPTAGTLDLSAIAGFDIRRLAAVFDLKTQAMIYGPVAGFGATAVTGGVLTLQASLAGLGASDSLLVIYDDATGKVAEDGTDITAASMPAGGVGIRGWLSAIHTKLMSSVAVTIASLPLPAGAAQDGTDITGATMPAGGAGIRGWLSAITTKLGGTLAISAATLPLPAGAAQDQTLGQAVTALGNITNALALLATDADVQATTAKVEAARALLAGVIKVDPSAVTSPISAVALPLPTGAASEGTLATIKSILAAQASIAESTWYDPTVTPNVFYFRRVTNTDGVVTEIFTDPSGNQVAFNANWKPLGSTASFQVLPAVSYDCVTAFTGASVSDVIVRIVILNLGVSPATVAASMWLNANTGAVLSSVTMANLKEVTRDIAIPDGYFATFGALADVAVATPATAGSFMATFRGFWTNWLARVPVLGTALMAGATPVTIATDDKLATAIGGAADAAATADTGTFSIPALIKRGLANWTTLLGRIPAQGVAAASASLPVAIASDQVSGLAKDGTDATAATMPAGGAGIRGWLSGIYGKLPALGLAAKSGSLPVVLASDQVTQLAQDGTDATAATQLSGGAGLRGWLSGIFVQALALATGLGTPADAANTTASTTTTIFGFLRRFSTNDDTALAAINATGTWQQNLLAAIGKILSNAPRVSTTGTLSAVGDTVVVACDGMNTALAQLNAAAAGVTGAAVFEVSADSQATWTAVNMVPYAGGAAVAGVSPSTATQVFEMACGGMTHVRLRCLTAFSAATGALVAAANGHKSLRVGAPAGNPLPILPSAVAGTSTTGTLVNIGDVVALIVEGMSTIDIEAICASASWAGTTIIEMLPKGGSTWYATSIEPFEGGPGVQALPTGILAQLFTKHGGGISQIRARAVTAITNGPVTVNISAYAGIKGARVSAPKANPVAVLTAARGLGDFAMPALGGSYGTPIGAPPATATQGISVFVPPGGTMSWTTQPISAGYNSGSPAPSGLVKTFSNPFSVPQVFNEPFDPTVMTMWVTAWQPGTGSLPPIPRWM